MLQISIKSNADHECIQPKILGFFFPLVLQISDIEKINMQIRTLRIHETKVGWIERHSDVPGIGDDKSVTEIPVIVM